MDSGVMACYFQRIFTEFVPKRWLLLGGCALLLAAGCARHSGTDDEATSLNSSVRPDSNGIVRESLLLDSVLAVPFVELSFVQHSYERALENPSIQTICLSVDVKQEDKYGRSVAPLHAATMVAGPKMVAELRKYVSASAVQAGMFDLMRLSTDHCPGDKPPLNTSNARTPTPPATATPRAALPPKLGKNVPRLSEYGSRKLGEEGIPTVHVCVGPTGKLSGEPSIKWSSGSPRLDKGALKFAKAVHYEPGTEDGKPVEACFEFRVRFPLVS